MGERDSRTLAKEQPHQVKAFERYYALSEGRSYEKVAEKMGVAVSTVKNWGRSFNWKERVDERDLQVAREVAGRTVDDMASRRARGLKIVQFALVQLAKAIADGRVKMTLGDLDKLIRLEEFLAEEPDNLDDLKFLQEVGFGHYGSGRDPVDD